MTPLELLATLTAQGIRLEAAGDNLRFDAPRGAVTPDLAAMIRQHKGELLALLQRPASEPAAAQPTAKASGSATVAQDGRGWRLDDRGRVVFNDSTTYAPTVTGGWVLVECKGRRMLCPGTLAVTP